MKRSPYLVPDPWPERVRQWLAVWVLCPVLGHRWRAKMRGEVCRRCSTFRDLGHPGGG